MAGYVFPARLFRPSSLQARILGASVSGGQAVSGEAQFGDLSGGGRWAVDFGEAALWSRAKVGAWRALSAAADAGAMQILVPLADRINQPVTNPLVTPDSFGLTIYDDGATPWVPDQVTAPLTSDAALGATQIACTFSAPRALIGGEHFSIEHPTWGWRMYRIIRVISGGAGSGDATVFDFRPPLREAAVISDLMNFDSPRCLMRTDGDMDLVIDRLKLARASARFVEAGIPV